MRNEDQPCHDASRDHALFSPHKAFSKSFQNHHHQAAGEPTLQITFLLLMGVGTPANVLLFLQNVSPIISGCRQKLPNTILSHMAVANVLVLLPIGISNTMAAFMPRRPLSSLGCKFLGFIHRMARSTTLCATCLLSTSQLFTLSPGRVGWTVLPEVFPKALGPSCSTCWLLGVLINAYVPVKVTGPRSIGNGSEPRGSWFCSGSGSSAAVVVLWLVPDAIFMGLMGWASVSMVLLLRRHQRRVQHLHNPRAGRGCPPETRATRTVLMLMVMFVSFYLLNSSFVFYVTIFLDTPLLLMQVSDVLEMCFPTLCPFLMILRELRMPMFCPRIF
ncbi:vomeronasal type-1 receptor 4-like [Talpa occidentalis]|uniref:vomeronasal type-1 receptor 4-like n=1 Tax=Talpa occidentalis TaxID=50954 RepID=UPI00188F8BFD|nr:vomeronasal type-1 receptor 4-like [Talpa occidentalis]